VNNDRRGGRASGRAEPARDGRQKGRSGAQAGSSRGGGARGGAAARDGTGRDGKGRGAASRDGKGRDGEGRGAAGRGAVGRDGKGRDVAGRDAASRDGKGRGAAGRDGAGRDGAGRGGAGRDGAGRDGAGRDRKNGRAGAPSRPQRGKAEPVTAPATPAAGPEIPAHVGADQLDAAIRAELRTLPRELADRVARHLAAAEQAGDAEIAYEHSVAARRLASRVGVVREACGVAAYLTGRWAEALSELRAARRLTGRAGYVAIMADCERALGRYDRALALVNGPDARPADRAEEVELRIVESGIRRDMGAAEAAVVLLQLPELTDGRIRPWSARLYYAYADSLLDVGRLDEARDWFARAAAADQEGETDAAERFDELDDVTIEDVEDTGGASPRGGP
jgi:hypothetical protein